MTRAAFAAVFTATVVAVRLALWIRPTPSPTIHGFRWHHWMTGLALSAPVALLYWPYPIWDVPLPAALISAVGVGLFADEATYLAIGGKTHADNYSVASLAGTAAIVAVCDALLLLSPGP